MSDDGAQLHGGKNLGELIPTHPVNIPCGTKPEYPEKTHDFGYVTLWKGPIHALLIQVEFTQVRLTCDEHVNSALLIWLKTSNYMSNLFRTLTLGSRDQIYNENSTYL
jgi:hypothetical protein